jgi:hypothetical protein
MQYSRIKIPLCFYHRLVVLAIVLFAVPGVCEEPIALSAKPVKPVASSALLNKTTSDNTALNTTDNISHTVATSIHLAEFQQLFANEQQTLATIWGLNATEYAHYLDLMEHSVDGLYYRDQHLDPAWILGINAKTDEEQRKYVTLAILHERERMGKLLRFQQAFDRIQRELFPVDKPIQISAQEKNHLIPVTCR